MTVILWTNSLKIKALKWYHPIEPIEANLKRKTVGLYVDTEDDGKSKGFLPGFSTSDGSSSDMNIIQRTF